MGSCTDQSWVSRVQTHQNDVLPQWFVLAVSEGKTEDNLVHPWHHFFMIKNSCCELMRKKDKVILTNYIVLYTRLTYVEP